MTKAEQEVLPAEMKVESANTDTLPTVGANFDPLVNVDSFEMLQRHAKMYAASSLLPDRFKGKIADCAIGIEMARMLQVHPLYLFKNLYIVHGSPGIQGELAKALVDAYGGYAHELRYEWVGTKGSDDFGCFAWTTTKDGAKVKGSTIDMKMAKSEGWSKNPKWSSMPEQMMQYRAASFFARANCGRVLGGLQIIDEVEHAIDVTPGKGASNLNEKLANKKGNV